MTEDTAFVDPDYNYVVEDFTYYYIDSNYEADFLYPPIANIIFSIILPIFFTIGILGNLGLLIVFVRIRTLRNSVNIYLLNVAFCDFGLLITAGPMLWKSFLTSPVEDDYYHVGIIGCKIVLIFVETCVVVSCLTFMIVSIERYLSICWPIRFRDIENPKRAVVFCIMLWLIVCVYRSPVLHYSYLHTVHLKWVNTTIIDPLVAPSEVAYCLICDGRPGQPTESACTKIHKMYFAEHYVLVAMMPLFVFLYSSMIVCLRSQISNQRHSSNEVIETKKHVVVMLLVTITVMLVTIIPARILLIILALTQTQVLPKTTIITILYISKCAMFINASVNPFIYITMSTGYRNAFKRCFFPNLCLKNNLGGDDQQRLKHSKGASSVLSLNNIGKNNICLESLANVDAIK
ncbi:G-protein coupled receptor 15-like [Antedon mediterranea]|uniref:G-protein coupled receptor 15-like n=1 Tax=Antedon mediterranea TaxID=105859 RepID=UPI003AF54B23